MKYFWPYLLDKDYPILEKLYIVLGIVYLVMPVDLLPEAVFPFGILDDSVVLVTLILYLKKLLKTYYQDKIEGEAQDFEGAIKVEYEDMKSGGKDEKRHQRDPNK